MVDRYGNAVSNTYTLNFSYGLGMVAEGTGVLLNNELDDFAAKPRCAQCLRPRRRRGQCAGPRQAAAVVDDARRIVLKDGKPFLVTGSPGGSRIITTVLQVMHQRDRSWNAIADAVAAARFHHQWLPDEVSVERGFDPATIRALEARGHRVVEGPPRGSVNTILVTPDGLVGAADPRTRGALAVGY